MIGTLIAAGVLSLVGWTLLRALREQLDDDAESMRRHDALRDALRQTNHGRPR